MIIPIESTLHSNAEAEELWYENARQLFSPGLNGGMCLVVDVTGSMGGIINNLTKNLIRYSDKMFKGQIDRLSLVCMDDHYSTQSSTQKALARAGKSDAVLFSEITNDGDTYTRWLKNCPRGSGADAAEAWACAVHAARILDPEANIWLCVDSFPHGKKYHSNGGDTYPQGCPCGIDLDLTGVSTLLFDMIPQHYKPIKVRKILGEVVSSPPSPLRKYSWLDSKFHLQETANPDAVIPFSLTELDHAFDTFLK